MPNYLFEFMGFWDTFHDLYSGKRQNPNPRGPHRGYTHGPSRRSGSFTKRYSDRRQKLNKG